jgi:hypothetical protein
MHVSINLGFGMFTNLIYNAHALILFRCYIFLSKELPQPATSTIQTPKIETTIEFEDKRSQ